MRIAKVKNQLDKADKKAGEFSMAVYEAIDALFQVILLILLFQTELSSLLVVYLPSRRLNSCMAITMENI